MDNKFLLYGSTGFLGREIARLAREAGLPLIIAGRDAGKVPAQAASLGVEGRTFDLSDPAAVEHGLDGVAVVLHCAGPYIHTWQPMVEACLRTGTHYLDITGEIPVLEGIAARGAEAKQKGVMLLPAVGFDVLPTDCLALHLKQRLPAATRLTLAQYGKGPSRFPPGSINTLFETVIPSGFLLRQGGQLVPFPSRLRTRRIDFGQGPVEATLFPWADAFTAYTSTGIPNIENYMVISPEMRRMFELLLRLRPLLRPARVRRFLKSQVSSGSTAEQRAATSTTVWGEVVDDQGRCVSARLYGPDGGVTWTSLAALSVVEQVLQGNCRPGFQTPAMAYGSDFVLQSEGVTLEDLA
jgi:short subunit dehydrogenase-like uncharacterized protein